jgi:hypothetical protein
VLLVPPQAQFHYYANPRSIIRTPSRAARALVGASVAPVQQVGLVNQQLFLVERQWVCTRSCSKTAGGPEAATRVAGWWRFFLGRGDR